MICQNIMFNGRLAVIHVVTSHQRRADGRLKSRA
jgi:hypothetical protein